MRSWHTVRMPEISMRVRMMVSRIRQWIRPGSRRGYRRARPGAWWPRKHHNFVVLAARFLFHPHLSGVQRCRAVPEWRALSGHELSVLVKQSLAFHLASLHLTALLVSPLSLPLGCLLLFPLLLFLAFPPIPLALLFSLTFTFASDALAFSLTLALTFAFSLAFTLTLPFLQLGAPVYRGWLRFQAPCNSGRRGKSGSSSLQSEIVDGYLSMNFYSPSGPKWKSKARRSCPLYTCEVLNNVRVKNLRNMVVLKIKTQHKEISTNIIPKQEKKKKKRKRSFWNCKKFSSMKYFYLVKSELGK